LENKKARATLDLLYNLILIQLQFFPKKMI